MAPRPVVHEIEATALGDARCVVPQPAKLIYQTKRKLPDRRVLVARLHFHLHQDMVGGADYLQVRPFVGARP